MTRFIKGIFSAVTAIAISSLSTSGLVTNTGTAEFRNNVSAAADSDEVKNELIKFSGSGERNGYSYKCIGCSENDEMELISPSLFKAKWDSTDAEYTESPVFERGKQFKPDQDLCWTMESSVDYEMEFEAEGTFFAGVHISLIAPETKKYYSRTEIYIIDASVNWEVPEDASYEITRTRNGTHYAVYHGSRVSPGTDKGLSENIYYFVNKYAEDHGKEGRVSARYDIAPFIDSVVYSKDFTSNFISVGINGGVSKGNAELVRNDISVPDSPRFDNPRDYINKRVYLDNGFHWDHYATATDGRNGYRAFGYDIELKGYVGEPLKFTWNYYKDGAEGFIKSEFRRVSCGIPKSFDTLSIIDWQGSMVYDDTDDLILEYSIDIGSIANKTEDSSWNIGADIQCMYDSIEPRSELASELLGDDPITYVHVIDKSENYSFNYDSDHYYPPKELGVITSNGVDYEVVIYKKKSDSAFTSITAIRCPQLSSTEADDVPEGYVRYENSLSVVDIVDKINALGIESGGIRETEFLFNTYDTSGNVLFNYADVKRIVPENKTYTADDVKLLSSYLLGKTHEIPECSDYSEHDYYEMDLEEYLLRTKKNYDVNNDGTWDIFDLCEMRKRIDSINTTTYVKPDEPIQFGSLMTVQADDLKLYAGPDESYEMITSIPKNSRITELGIQHNNDKWFFTEYNGNYGWAKTNQDDNKTLTCIYDNYDYKPVIYLYPEQETDVRFELELTESDLYTTYPKYNNGWDVTAYPDGTLLNKTDGTHHKYLFWESSNCRTRYDFSEGFCVAGSDTESFLREKLTYMGLTEEEMNEFIVYWLPLMEHNKYNLISFQGDAYTNSAKLNITPTPDSILRVFMAYVPLEDAVDIQPQKLDTFARNGFTVVEWGGTKILS